MNHLLEPLRALVVDFEKERGEFDMLGLFLRDDEQSWDLVVSASWMQSIADSGYKKEFVTRLAKSLPTDWSREIAAVVPIDRHAPFVDVAAEAKWNRQGGEHVGAFSFDGSQVPDAFVLSARRPRLRSLRNVASGAP